MQSRTAAGPLTALVKILRAIKPISYLALPTHTLISLMHSKPSKQKKNEPSVE
jgi:hypothetical protein